MNTVTRRDFLKTSAVASLAATALPAGSWAAHTGMSPGPFKRTGKPRLLLSLAAYTFRETFPTMRGKANAKLDQSKAIDMFKFIDYCAAHGCDGAEPTTYFFAEESDDYVLKLRRHAYLRGMPISGTAIGNNFSHPKGPKLNEEIAATKKWIDRAFLLGTQHIRVFAGNVPRDAGITRAEADKNVITALAECCDYAGKKGI